MWHRVSPPRFASLSAALLPLLLAAACRSPGAERIVGPDGSQMSHVHCGAEQSACFRLAGELCPAGYDIQPVLRQSDGNFLVRCRAARVARQCPTPVAARPSSPAPFTPPASAPPSASVEPSSVSPSAANEIDLGY
jgi:hypothetical protein